MLSIHLYDVIDYSYIKATQCSFSLCNHHAHAHTDHKKGANTNARPRHHSSKMKNGVINIKYEPHYAKSDVGTSYTSTIKIIVRNPDTFLSVLQIRRYNSLQLMILRNPDTFLSVLQIRRYNLLQLMIPATFSILRRLK